MQGGVLGVSGIRQSDTAPPWRDVVWRKKWRTKVYYLSGSILGD